MPITSRKCVICYVETPGRVELVACSRLETEPSMLPFPIVSFHPSTDHDFNPEDVFWIFHSGAWQFVNVAETEEELLLTVEKFRVQHAHGSS